MAAKTVNSTWLGWYAVAAMIGIFLVQDILTAWRQTETIPYSQFELFARQGSVSEVTVGLDTISGMLKEPSAEGRRFFVAKRVDPALAERLIEKGILKVHAHKVELARDLSLDQVAAEDKSPSPQGSPLGLTRTSRTRTPGSTWVQTGRA